MIEDKDFENVRAFVSGDERAFNTIAQKYQQKIYWHARRMVGNHLDADEVTQEVLIVLYNKLKDFRFNSSLYTWIFRITSTRSINQINKRRIKKILFLDDSDYESLSSDENILNNLESKEKLAELDKILQKLPVKQREVFMLRHFDGLSYEEISKISGKSIGGLKSNYFHALNKVLEMMN
ncbi:MAG: RNA polymerase sigma factor [Ignavibacteriales bacterium]|nr:RNA polymerase sigma factor [Ignavibacteriales bacterium]